MASDPGGSPHSRSGRRTVLLCGPQHCPVAGGFSGPRPLRHPPGLTKGLWLPPGPPRRPPLHVRAQPGGDQGNSFPHSLQADPGRPPPAQHSTRGQPSPGAGPPGSPHGGFSRLGDILLQLERWSPISARAAPGCCSCWPGCRHPQVRRRPLGRSPLRVTGCSVPACGPQDPHAPSREVTCPQRGAPPTGVNMEGWSSGHVFPRMQTRVHTHFCLLGNLPTFRSVMPKDLGQPSGRLLL